MKSKLTVMCVGAHTADSIDLAGGALRKHVLNGDSVIIVNLTHGAYSHAGLLIGKYAEKFDSESEMYQAIIAEKHNEAIRAANALGITNVINVGYDDEPLEINRERVFAIAELLRKFKPDILISHHPNEYTHEDHSICGLIVIKALKAAVKFYPNSQFEKHHVPAVYFFGIQFLSKQARLGYVALPHNILVDIGDVVEDKVKAFIELWSQKNTEKVVRERINSLERENGRLDGISFSESFISFYPSKVSLLPANSDSSWYKLQDELMGD